MDKIGTYTTTPFTSSRQNIMMVAREGKRKNSIHCLLELDVTDARTKIHDGKTQHARDISFTAWLIFCVSKAISEHKQLNTYRYGRKKMVTFDEVDIPVPIEREIGGQRRPLAYLIRKANEKTIEQITQEIRQAQKQPVDETTQIIGQQLTPLEKYMINAPVFLKKIGLTLLRNNGVLRKKHLGTVGVTSIGMKGHFPGWVIPLGGPVSTLIAVAGITKKPGVVGNEIAVRDFLHVSVTVDHDIVDGGPLARFIERFTELVETAHGL